jgi:hypothetical protein
MQLWQMDVMGGVELQDGTELKVVTGVDDHSRFCVAAGLVTRATSKAVCEVLAASLSSYGIPDEILTDNGKCFTGRFGPNPSRGPVRPDPARERDLPSAHRRALTDHDRQGRAVPPEPEERVPCRPELHLTGGRSGRARRLGGRLQHEPAPPGPSDGHAGRAVPSDASGQGQHLTPVDQTEEQAGQGSFGVWPPTATSPWTTRPSRSVTL